ncbi:hypothetical protein HBN50_10175 [Halobacteriovorax sp. GB3]|uniref:hypothetical protein n=1 Tax=Halobacteriovorax sp. GB3 TaxID=2719615 RepID=UPI0023616949|nr:hypothetical protein [Halobacteriovorax sp. GB3]MDD0853467.1 hypothetical protein [Halobacteriovorax sp. GB3]
MKLFICVLLLPFTALATDSLKTWNGKFESHVEGLDPSGLRSGILHGKVSINRTGNHIDLEDCLNHGVTTPYRHCSTVSLISSGSELYIRDENNNAALLVGTITDSEFSYKSLRLGIRGSVKYLENGNLSVFIQDGLGDSSFNYTRESMELILE